MNDPEKRQGQQEAKSLPEHQEAEEFLDRLKGVSRRVSTVTVYDPEGTSSAPRRPTPPSLSAELFYF